MRILEVIPRFNPRHGGGVNVVYNYSKFLARRGHDVTVITTDTDFPEDFAITLRNDGVKVVPFHSFFNIALFIYSPSMNKWLKDNLREFDVVHLNGARTYQNNCIMRHATRSGKRWVMQAHGSIGHIVSRKGIKTLYDFVWGKRLFDRTSRFIALTETEAKAHVGMGIPCEKVDIIPNGIDPETLRMIPEKGLFIKKYGIKNRMVLYLGRMHPSKGIEVLIHAFSLMKDDALTTLVIAGPDDGHLESLKELAFKLGVSDRIIFTGLLSEDDKMQALRDAEVFVTPRFYGYPITFLEAMACGTPIVTSNDGDVISDLDGNYGRVTQYNDKAISIAVREIINDERLRERMSVKARERVRELTWDVIMKDVERTYSLTLDRDSARM